MDIRELRIGNFVSYSPDSTIFEITEIHKTGLGVKSEDEETWIEIEDFEGILIDEEWLLNFGFDVHPNQQNRFLLNCELFTINFIVADKNNYFWLNESCIFDLKYVHQLQNFYYTTLRFELQLLNC